ncbi:MAG: hypothetical protein M3R70_03110 [Actinomycetota bacterium]|nr:hypothetical protein [Actinomycetota bacterium]
MPTSAGLRVIFDAKGFVSRGWCQGVDARDARGEEVEPWDEAARSWSLLGAIVAVLEVAAREEGEIPLEELAACLYALADVIEVDSLAEWNDHPGRAQAEVLEALAAAEDKFEPPWPEEAQFHAN